MGYKEVKAYLKQAPPIKFANADDSIIKHWGPERFIKNLLSLNHQYDTMYVMSGMLQCKRQSRRTIGDLYRLANYYFPGIPLSKVYIGIVKEIREGRALSSICADLRMRVYRKTDGYEKACFNGPPTDEFKKDFTTIVHFGQGSCVKRPDWWGSDATIKDIDFIDITENYEEVT